MKKTRWTKLLAGLLACAVTVSAVAGCGSTEKEGTSVDLVLSDGSQMKVAVPYLIGKDIDTARKELEDLGLKPGKINYESSTTYSVNQVMWQQYDANKEVSKGTSVKLTVSTGPEEAKEIDYYIDFSQAENEMFFMTVTLSDSDGTRKVIDHQQRIKSEGGETVKLEGKGTGTVIVTFDNKQIEKKKVDFTKGTIR